MLRRIVGGVAFAAVLATSAHAQSNPFTATFTLTAHNGLDVFGVHSVISDRGSYNGYEGQIDGPPSFQVYCVDETHHTPLSAPYNVWVTSFNDNPADAFSHTRAGNVTQYEEAAWLTAQFNGLDDTANPPVSGAAGQNAQIQYAIWEVMGYTDGPNVQMKNSADVNFWVSQAQMASNYSTINLDDWVIISDASGVGQEYIANVSFKRDVTPEPATMAMLATGLVGMAGAGLRRRRRNK